MWTKQQVRQYEEAAGHLYEIQALAFNYAKGKTEYEVQQFILKEFRHRGMRTNHPPIVAYNDHAAQPHYAPRKRGHKLEQRSLVLIDLWAKMDRPRAPFADITWMGYHGKPSKEVLRLVAIVFEARDKGIAIIRRQLRQGKMPTGAAIDIGTTDVLRKHDCMRYFKHRTGHSLGTTSPHGRYRGVVDRNTHVLHKSLGYTIEPGIYIDGRFGVRSEIDFYINEHSELKISRKQTKLTII